MGLRVENGVTYLLHQYSTGTTSGEVYVLCRITPDGSVVTKEVYKPALISGLKSGLKIENIELENNGNSIKYKGGLTEEDYKPGNKNRVGMAFVCLAEIKSANSDKILAYKIVTIRGDDRIVPKEELDRLVRRGAVLNYYCTDAGEVRRMPNQNIGIATSLSGDNIITDTYTGITEEWLCRILENSGFKLGYKSEVYMEGLSKDKEHVTYGWYDSDGAVVWYTLMNFEDSVNKSFRPTRDGIHLLLDCSVISSIDSIVSDSRNSILVSSSQDAHQHIHVDGIMSLTGQYKLLKPHIRINRVWDYSDGIYDYNLDKIQRLDIYNKALHYFGDVWAFSSKKRVGYPFRSPILELIAMKLTLHKIRTTGADPEFMSIFDGWEQALKGRLEREIINQVSHRYQPASELKQQLDYCRYNDCDLHINIEELLESNKRTISRIQSKLDKFDKDTSPTHSTPQKRSSILNMILNSGKKN